MRPAGVHKTAPAGPRLQLLVAAIALVAAACGGSDPVPEPPASTAASTTVAPSGVIDAPLDVQGHRGARGLRPENTLPAFETALDLGVTTLELDLHFTADDQVVVWHDPDINREKCGLAEGAAADVPDPDDVLVASRDRMIRALTVSQLAGYRCDRNPDTDRYPAQVTDPTAIAGDDYGIATLAELFTFVDSYSRSELKTPEQRSRAADIVFNIETKRRPDEPANIDDGFDGVAPGPFELEVLRVVAEHDVASRVVIQSFDHRSLWAIRSVDEEVPLAALTSGGTVDFDDLATRGATIWSPSRRDVSARTLAAAQAAGLLVIPWTVNEPDEMSELIELGVDGLITDRPDLLIELTMQG